MRCRSEKSSSTGVDDLGQPISDFKHSKNVEISSSNPSSFPPFSDVRSSLGLATIEGETGVPAIIGGGAT